jgi:shikimate kinase
MNDIEQNEPIILIGFSTILQGGIGRSLADCLNASFYDLNEEVEKLLSRVAPSEIGTIGWQEIANIQKNVLGDLVTKKSAVIATGSDVVDEEENFEILKSSDSIIIYLHERFTEKFAQQLSDQLFSKKKLDTLMVDVLQFLFDVRDETYRNIADLMLEIDGKEVNQISNEIATFITTEVGEDDLF